MQSMLLPWYLSPIDGDIYINLFLKSKSPKKFVSTLGQSKKSETTLLISLLCMSWAVPPGVGASQVHTTLKDI